MRGNAVQPEPFRTNGSRARLQDKWQPSAVESLISLGFAALSATLVEPETQVPDDCETAWRGASPTLFMMMFVTIADRSEIGDPLRSVACACLFSRGEELKSLQPF